MRKVVDSNYLRNPGLRAYLSASQHNMAVLTDYASMEAYKGDTLISIYNSMAILAEFPSQVLVLNEAQTRDFGTYCRHLAVAKAGNVRLQRQLLDFGQEATQHLEKRMLADAGTFPEVIELIAANYTKEELVALRTAAPYSDAMVKKFITSVLQVSLTMFQSHPRVQNIPNRKEVPNTFVFRAALCAYLLALDWIAMAGPQGAKGASLKRLRNDIVDVNFAAYATYFDGLLSCDGKTRRIHDQARLFLAKVSGCHISGLAA